MFNSTALPWPGLTVSIARAKQGKGNLLLETTNPAQNKDEEEPDSSCVKWGKYWYLRHGVAAIIHWDNAINHLAQPLTPGKWQCSIKVPISQGAFTTWVLILMATCEEGISIPIGQNKIELQKVDQSKIMQWGQAKLGNNPRKLSVQLFPPGKKLHPPGSWFWTPPEGWTCKVDSCPRPAKGDSLGWSLGT